MPGGTVFGPCPISELWVRVEIVIKGTIKGFLQVSLTVTKTAQMASSFHIDPSFTGYGKGGVRLLKIKRSGKYHEIKQIEVATELKLNNYQDYLVGDNASVIPTDTQKNTVYALAKVHPLNNIEEFALHICNHFLTTHKQVDHVSVEIDETPWKRIQQKGVDHAHAFVLNPEVTRFCSATQARGEDPKLSGGLKDMQILKTTQSGFTGFCRTSSPFCQNLKIVPSVLKCIADISLKPQEVWTTISVGETKNFAKDTILEKFAGPPDTGVYSPSVQNTLYKAEEKILNSIPQIGNVEMMMPNIHYFTVNMAPFGMANKDEILMATDKPAGLIKAALSRKPKAKL
ncbi:hypothetical protein OS493_019697 [Desmophyllum pertusum]|uniref:Uricase n=1 Tax=Desmophyllum pertusum TaxID=174260 RepID=A0A9X0CS69_9CNID|nr:hypothetical protein OS493_019697 [Desmophyllum pertusum]